MSWFQKETGIANETLQTAVDVIDRWQQTAALRAEMWGPYWRDRFTVNTADSNGEMKRDYKKKNVKGGLVGQSFENTDRENSLLWKVMASDRQTWNDEEEWRESE
jgi:adenine-specific DNA methylase